MTDNKKNILNRYPGVKPFSPSEKILFFGRSNEISAAKKLISINQTIVLYGKSGYGKSSLINAGIIPDLKAENSFIYFTIRFNNYSEKGQNLPPVETVKQRLKESTDGNIYQEFRDLIPDTNTFWYWIKQSQAHNRKSRFIIFFDQFEELFTYPKDQIIDFAEQLSEVLYDTVPTDYRIRISDLYEQNTLDAGLHDFIEKKIEIKAVFSIRSDRLSLMNGLKDRLPSILQNCYELNALNEEDAASAIVEPARLEQKLGFRTPPFHFTQGAIEKILHSIANQQDGKIEAATLQIIGRYIEDTLVAEKGHTVITEDVLGDITDIFQQYYENTLNKLPPEERLKAQGLIEDELIEGGRRNPLTAGYIQNKFGLNQQLLGELEKSSLLKKERDAAGRILYEISHDTLIAAINKVGNTRRIMEEQRKNLQLQKEINDERQRAEELNTARNKAVRRLKFARAMSGIAVLMVGIAIYFLLQANRNAAKAKDQEKIALMNASNARVQAKKTEQAYLELKKERDLAEVNRLIVIGDDFVGNRTTDRACITYDSALSILMKYNDKDLSAQDLQQKQELHYKIKRLCGK